MPTTVDDADTTHPAAAARQSASFLSRLTTGTGAFNVLGRRRYYYIFSSILVLGSILFILFRGFNFGIDFAGGTRLTFQPANGAAVDIQSITKTFDDAVGTSAEGTVQTIGQQHTIQISSGPLSATQVSAAKAALTNAYHPVGGISDAAVSGTWGSEISVRAGLAVIIFLVLVGVFIWIRYEKRVAVGAVASTIHDVLVTAGIYAAVGFEVSPATVIGLLTILGFSLYDTVVVYDKVQENSKGLTTVTRRTYPEAANLAVNQTLMRSINTSLIALLPVAGLLVAGVALLGAGTLKDLALVLLVGMLVGAYSSVFIAVPLAVDLKIREPQIKAHIARVLAKRKAEGLIVDADGDPVGRKQLDSAPVARPRAAAAVGAVPGMKPGVAPRPGIKPPAKQRTAAKPSLAKPAVSPASSRTADAISIGDLSAPAGATLSPPAATPAAVTPAASTPAAVAPSTPAATAAPAAAAAPVKKPAGRPAARPRDRPGSVAADQQLIVAGEAIDRLTRTEQDFPIPGVLFRDLTPVLADPAALQAMAGALADACGPVDLIAGLESRGFLLAAAAAMAAGTGVLAIRKPGKLPGVVLSEEYALEYGTARLELHADDVPDGCRMLIIDDVLATGGTAAAAVRLVRRAGGVVAGVAVAIELADLGGRARLDVPVVALRSV